MEPLCQKNTTKTQIWTDKDCTVTAARLLFPAMRKGSQWPTISISQSVTIDVSFYHDERPACQLEVNYYLNWPFISLDVARCLHIQTLSAFIPVKFLEITEAGLLTVSMKYNTTLLQIILIGFTISPMLVFASVPPPSSSPDLHLYEDMEYVTLSTFMTLSST